MEEDKKLIKRQNLEIIILSIIVVALLGICIYMLFIKKGDKPVDNNGGNNQQINDNNDSFKNVNITKENLESFLSLMVGSGNYSYNNIYEVVTYSNEDYATFNRIIRMLFSQNKYEKKDMTYYFNLSDANELARKYFNKKNFNYDEENYEHDKSQAVNYVLNKTTNKYESSLSFGLFDEMITWQKLVVNSFKVENDSIVVDCSINGLDGNNEINEEITKDYVIKLGYEDNSYIIKSISIK